MNTCTNLNHLGFNPFFREKAEAFPNFYPGRIIGQERELYHVMTENGEFSAQISGKFRYQASDSTDFPAVGDFVLLDQIKEKTEISLIHHRLERQSVLVRRAAGTANERQIVAANVDKVFICMALNEDFNLRRSERYLSFVWDSGAVPVFVLTKSDLCDHLEEKILALQEVALGVDIVLTNGRENKGYLPLLAQIKPEQTVAFIGSSGVGKSTLINRLLGEEFLKTNGLRNDGKGRHTTTQRKLFKLETGGLVIDTPGMREIGLETANFSESFSDIDELALCCKFSDCKHEAEPQCAVKKAVEKGELSAHRLLNYQKMKREVGYENLNAKQIEQMKSNEMFKAFGGMKKVKKALASKSRKND